MAYSYTDILSAQFTRLDAEQASASADLEAARLSDDAWSVNSAADRILQIDAQRMALAARANQFVANQQQPQGNRYGLSNEEIETAKVSGISDEQYFRNKQRMQSMKAQGYWR